MIRTTLKWTCHLCDTGVQYVRPRDWQATIIDHLDWRHIR